MPRPLPIEADMFLYAAGRNGNNADLACDKAGLHPDERETLKVDEIYRSAVPHICAAGDVIGFPALGSTSMDQGRVAVSHMFGLHGVERVAKEFPYGITSVNSSVTERQMGGTRALKGRSCQER